MSRSAAIVVHPEGELDLVSIGPLAARLRGIIDGPSPPCGVVVDLADVTFLDSSAMSVLLNARRRATRAGVRLTLHAPEQSTAAATLELAGLRDTLDAHPSLTDACGAACRPLPLASRRLAG